MATDGTTIGLSAEQVKRLQAAILDGATLTPQMVTYFANDFDLKEKEIEKGIAAPERDMDFHFRSAIDRSIFDKDKIVMKPIRGSLCI
tara:strand:+ start:312 stop:575 length:264 start_codon:yes stop_codon:yes gene_type:complete